MKQEEIYHYETEQEGASSPSIQGLVNHVKPSKESIYKISEMIAVSVDEGHIDPVTADTKMKFIIETLTQAREKIKGQVVDAVAKAGKAGIAHYGATVELMEGGTKYDYSSCGDSVLVRLTEQSDKLKKQIEQRQKMLKSIEGALTIADEETGEMIELRAPIKSSTTTIKTTWK